MSYADNPNIQEVSWDKVENLIKRVEPELHDLIKRFKLTKNHTLLKVTYRYGDILLREGMFYLPDKQGKLHPINHPYVPDDLRKKLSYSSFPLGVITNGGNEVYFETENRVVSLAFFEPGVILGLWETLDPETSHFPKKIWNVYSGARSLITLPMISEASCHNRLKKKYGIKSPPAKKMIDHARLFSELAKSNKFNSTWTNEVIFFTSEWLDQKYYEQPYWLKLQHYFLKKAWDLSGFNRNQVSYDCVWQFFSEKLEKQNIKINAYTLDTMKHLIAIGLGAFPGFKPVGQKQLSGPTHRIQEILLEDYGLKWYIPTIMEPGNFKPNGEIKYLYYPLLAPTLIESSPHISQTKIIAETRKIKNLMNIFYDEAISGSLKIEHSSIEWLINNVKFDYFHTDEDSFGEIRLSGDMPKEDPSLLFTPMKTKNSIFTESSSFVRGCVRLGNIRD